MAITKGVEGIRKARTVNKVGWHIIVNDTRIGYFEESFTSIINRMQGRLTYIGGNVLMFED